MKVLLIEDSARLLRSLGQGLRKEGFVVDMASDGRAGLLDAETSDYDVVVLDLMLPGMDGWTILQRLRAQGKNTPILILSAKDQVHHRTRGLNMGADDYLIKPFAFDELCARIRALIRRRYHVKDPCIRLDALMLNTAMRQAYIRSQHLALTRNEYALLECLALRRGHVHTRALLQDQLYAYDAEVTSNVIDVMIYTLRKKIRRAGGEPIIHTIRGQGYVIP
jgi:DNA-binding response OmpR family regulator